jgi:hypothetical protein
LLLPAHDRAIRRAAAARRRRKARKRQKNHPKHLPFGFPECIITHISVAHLGAFGSLFGFLLLLFEFFFSASSKMLHENQAARRVSSTLRLEAEEACRHSLRLIIIRCEPRPETKVEVSSERLVMPLHHGQYLALRLVFQSSFCSPTTARDISLHNNNINKRAKTTPQEEEVNHSRR